MAGVMAAVMHAPLTGIFLIAELTGGYNLFLPLMLVSTSSYATIRLFMPHSIYSLRLAQKGKLLTHQKDKAVLTLMTLDAVIEKDLLLGKAFGMNVIAFDPFVKRENVEKDGVTYKIGRAHV